LIVVASRDPAERCRKKNPKKERRKATGVREMQTLSETSVATGKLFFDTFSAEMWTKFSKNEPKKLQG
jgi:hypothetical protein